MELSTKGSTLRKTMHFSDQASGSVRRTCLYALASNAGKANFLRISCTVINSGRAYWQTSNEPVRVHA